MNYPFTIEDLASKCQVTKQSIYNLISKNKEFVKENSKKQGRKIKYNQAVLDLFLGYYDKLEEAPAEETITPEAEQPTEAPEKPTEAPAAESTPEAPEAPAEGLQAQIEALQGQVRELKEQLAAKEAERLELLKQNGALILTIQQQQQERMLLLPAPKKSIGERFKGLFGKKEQGS